MSFEEVDLAPPSDRDITLPSPFKKILSKTSELEGAGDDFSPESFYEQIKTIKLLEYELSSSKNQALLDKLDHDKREAELKKDMKAKDEEISQLSLNEKFLFEQNQELQKQIDELKKAQTANINTRDSEIAKLRRLLAVTQDQLTELKYQIDSQTSKYEIKERESSSKIEQLQQHITGLQSNLDQQIEINNTNTSKIRQLQTELENSKLSQPDHVTDGSTELLYKKQFNSQIEYISKLENDLKKSQSLIQNLSKNNELVQVLKEERISLVRKVESYKLAQDESDSLRIQFKKLQQEHEKYQELVDELGSASEFVYKVKMTMEENKSLKDKTVNLSVEISGLRNANTQLTQQIDDLRSNLAKLKTELQDLQLVVLKTNSLRQLLEQEVQFTKNQIEFFTTENRLLISGDKSKDQASSNELKTIQQLQELVSHYKSELTSSIDEFKNRTNANIGEKRKRESDSPSRVNEDHVRKLTSLELELGSKNKSIQLLQDNVSTLTKQIQDLQQSESKTQSQNLTPTDMESLKRENEELLNSLKQNGQITSVPRSVYDRLLEEQRSFQDKLFESNKKQTRLKELFEKQFTRFNTVIYRLLGYKVEFEKMDRIKVIPSKAQDGDYIVFDLVEDPRGITLQLDQELTHLIYLDEQVVNNLVEFWIQSKNDIPCFLSGLNLELYEKINS